MTGNHYCKECQLIKPRMNFRERHCEAAGRVYLSNICRACEKVRRGRRATKKYPDHPGARLRAMLRDLWPYRPGPEADQ